MLGAIAAYALARIEVTLFFLFAPIESRYVERRAYARK